VADAGIQTVWLDNPPVNAIGSTILDAIAGALEALDAGTRVVVLRGSGERAFSAGADIAGFQGQSGTARGIQQTAALIEAAKELKAENEHLRQRIEALEQKS